VVSRITANPEIVFVKARALSDAEGNRYIDYHAAFALHFGHNHPYVTEPLAAFPTA
jgi:4-aminobutyrate aminotransferase-like enzyme